MNKIPVTKSLIILAVLQFLSISSIAQAADSLLLAYEKAYDYYWSHYTSRNIPPSDTCKLLDLTQFTDQRNIDIRAFTELRYLVGVRESFPLDQLCGVNNLVWVSIYSEKALPSCPNALKNVQYLTYLRPNMQEIPSIITELSQLNYLHIALNRKKCDVELRKLSKLKHLYSLSITFNRRIKFPEIICSFHHLRELNFGESYTFTLPPSFTELNNLQALQITTDLNNKNTIQVLKQLKKLRKLEITIGHCNYIPDDISSLNFLHQLHIYSKSLSEDQMHKIKTLLPNVQISFSGLIKKKSR